MIQAQTQARIGRSAIVGLLLLACQVHPLPAWSQPTLSPATQVYQTTLRFAPGSARLSASAIRSLREVVPRAEKVQLPRIRVTVDGGGGVWHFSRISVRKRQGEAILHELRRAGLKEIPIDLEGVGPNDPKLAPRGPHARVIYRDTVVSIWDIRGG